ncbi:MAG: (deoxy)nucleoside triphosphate pyrophosphohydrolase [Proteobacteria bacterium]|nr:(deoxy)nucleoside triphosphate pyrophosphohydrolase [Pseudomonadota bacterium]
MARNERFLVTRRGPDAARANQWEFPGGKVEDGETDEAALVRELEEELAIEVDVQEFVAEVKHNYPELAIHLLLYRCNLAKGDPQLREHIELRWADLRDLARFDWAPADRILCAKLYGAAQFMA